MTTTFKTFEKSAKRLRKSTRRSRRTKRQKPTTRKLTRKQKSFLVEHHVKTVFVCVAVLFGYAALWHFFGS